MLHNAPYQKGLVLVTALFESALNNHRPYKKVDTESDNSGRYEYRTRRDAGRRDAFRGKRRLREC
jgi:hypothetical protein